MRMGLHVHSSRGADRLVDYCRAVKPAIVKFLPPDRQLMERVKGVSPGTRIVWRPYWQDQVFDQHREFTNHALRHAQGLRGVVDWVEGWNEYTARDPREMARFAEHEVRYAEALNAVGVGAAIGGYSTGFLDESGYMFDAARPILELCHRRGGDRPSVIWHSHEYAAPYMQYMCRTPDGRNQWLKTPSDPRGSFTGVSTDTAAFWAPALDGWLTLRYRMLWARLVREGLTGVRMFFSECGIDDVNPRPGGANRKGWRDYHGSEWSRLPGIGDYADQLRWYGWHLSHDHYVLGWVDFGYGTEDPAWNSFALDQTPDMMERVMREQIKLPEGYLSPAPAPLPTPPTIPTPPVSPAPMPAVRAAVQVEQGDGWYAVCRRAYGVATVSGIDLIKAANPEVAVLHTGQRLWVPGYEVRRVR